MVPRASMVFLVLAFFAVAALAKPDIDVCEAALVRGQARDMVGPREINTLCVLADRGYLGTNVDDCFTKLSSDKVLGRQLARADTVFICDAIRDVVVSYLASHLAS